MSQTSNTRPRTSSSQTSDTQSPTSRADQQTEDPAHKIKNQSHLRIMIRRAEEPGQNARNSVWGWCSC